MQINWIRQVFIFTNIYGTFSQHYTDDEETCGDDGCDFLVALEEIDDEADSFGMFVVTIVTHRNNFRNMAIRIYDFTINYNFLGIDMVKVPEGDVAQEFGIMSIPTLAYFRRGTALIYEGDLTDPQAILGNNINNSVLVGFFCLKQIMIRKYMQGG